MTGHFYTMLRPQTTRRAVNQVNRPTRTASDKATVQQQDNFNTSEGLNAMYAAYLLHCDRKQDSVLAAYINLHGMLSTHPVMIPPDPGDVEKIKPEQFYTVSQYARKKGLNGFNSNFASRISRKAKNQGATFRVNEMNVRMYTASILEPIFRDIF